MRRVRLVLTVTAMFLFAAAATAWARGDGWQPLPPPPPFDIQCGSTPVHVTFPVDRQYFRNLPQQDGTIIQQITGSLFVHFATDSGPSVTLNLSGPGSNVIYPNGDFELHGEGLNGGSWSPDQTAALGMPEQWASSGLIDVIIHADGSVVGVRIPHNVTDICAELGV